MQDGMDFSIVVFIILAAFVGWRLLMFSERAQTAMLRGHQQKR